MKTFARISGIIKEWKKNLHFDKSRILKTKLNLSFAQGIKNCWGDFGGVFSQQVRIHRISVFSLTTETNWMALCSLNTITIIYSP